VKRGSRVKLRPCWTDFLSILRLSTIIIWQADQNGHPTRPQPMATPQAYPLGYVEDVVEARTKLGIVFISLLRFGAAETNITIARLR
jgi:hypothetical protein